MLGDLVWVRIFFSQTFWYFFQCRIFLRQVFPCKNVFRNQSAGYFFSEITHTPLPQVESGVDYLIGSWSNGIFLGKISGYKQMFYLADTPHIVDKIRSSPGLRIRLAFLACLSQKFNYFVFEWP